VTDAVEKDTAPTDNREEGTVNAFLGNFISAPRKIMWS
jgi:hypothetical protein